MDCEALIYPEQGVPAYPYFFLNVDSLTLWLGILLLGSLALDYGFYVPERVLRNEHNNTPRSKWIGALIFQGATAKVL